MGKGSREIKVVNHRPQAGIVVMSQVSGCGSECDLEMQTDILGCEPVGKPVALLNGQNSL